MGWTNDEVCVGSAGADSFQWDGQMMKFALVALGLFALGLIAGCASQPNGPRSLSRPAPLVLNFRPSQAEPNGYILLVTNTSDKRLACRVVTHDLVHAFGI